MKKLVSSVVLAAMLLTISFSAAFAKEEYRLKMGYSASDKESNYITFLDVFKKDVETNSKGRITVDCYPNAQLGGERQMMEGITLGTIEMALLSPGIAAAIAPRFQVLDLPYLFKDRAAAYKVLDGKIIDILNGDLLKKGVRLMGFAENGFREMTTASKEIHSPADLKGVKVRVQPIPAHLELFKTFGATPTAIDFGELYTALLQKTVDAQENPPTLIYSSKLYEVQKCISLTDHVYAPTGIFISEKFLKGLPADLQKVVKDATARYIKQSRINQQKATKELLDLMQKKHGVKVYTLTPAEKKVFMDTAKKVFKVMEPVVGKDMIDLVTSGK